MYRVASARNRYRGTARRSRKSSNRYLRMAQRMRQDGIGAVDGPITPPLRGSRRSRAARRRLMRWGANQRLAPRLQHIHTGVGALLFPVFVGCRRVSFPPTGSPAGFALVLPTPPQGGSDSLGMFERQPCWRAQTAWGCGYPCHPAASLPYAPRLTNLSHTPTISTRSYNFLINVIM